LGRHLPSIEYSLVPGAVATGPSLQVAALLLCPKTVAFLFEGPHFCQWPPKLEIYRTFVKLVYWDFLQERKLLGPVDTVGCVGLDAVLAVLVHRRIQEKEALDRRLIAARELLTYFRLYDG
jgi:hypothetical protein